MTVPEEAIARAARHFEAGDLERAAKLCKRFLKAHPKHVNALHLLGVVTYKAGKPKKAVGYLEGAAAGAAPDGELYRNLGFALRDSQQPREAAAAFARALELDPADIVARFQLAVLLAEAGAGDEAVAHFAEVLRRDPRNAQAQYNHANALRKARRYREALDSFARAADLAPTDPQVFVGWGLTLHRLDQWEDTIAKYERALELDADNEGGDIFVNLGHALRETGRVDEAARSFRRALALDPGHVEAIVGQATICDRNRQFEEARQLVLPFLGRKEPPVSALLLYAALASHFDEADRAHELLRAALQRKDLRDDQAQRICFNLGKRCDQAGLFDEAFAYYERANALYDGHYDIATKTRLVDELIGAFPRDVIEALPRARVETDVPVFIVGMPRSGTTLVEQILASHGRAEGAGELREIRRFVADLPNTLGCGEAYCDIAAALSQDALDSLAERYLKTLRAIAPDAARVTDKMPHNFEQLWFIRALFPRAPIVHCVRNPVDTCLSCFFQAFGERHTYTRSLPDLARHYVDYRRLMAHWRTVIGGPFIELAYEDVVAEPEAQSRRLVDFCGLEWDPACLAFHENRRFVATASYDQVRQPIYATSAGRHVHYDKYLVELKQILEAAGI